MEQVASFAAFDIARKKQLLLTTVMIMQQVSLNLAHTQHPILDTANPNHTKKRITVIFKR